MPALPLGNGEDHRLYGRLPRLRLRNMFLEADKSNAIDQLARLQRPGLSPLGTIGTGPINAVWRQGGTFGGDYLVVSGAVLYRVTANGAASIIGAVPPGRAQIVASDERAIVVIGDIAYSTDGATLTPVNMPKNESVTSVAFISGFFVLVVAQSQRYYWLAPGEVNPDGLSFAEAERSPDAIVTAMVVGDAVWFLGTESEEVWQLTGDINAPFQRVNGLVYKNGCVARDAAVEIDVQLIWVAADFQVMSGRGAPVALSTPGIVEHLRRANPLTFHAWAFKLDSHIFYVLTTEFDTFAVDLSTKVWSRFSTFQHETWRAHGLVYGTLGGTCC